MTTNRAAKSKPCRRKFDKAILHNRLKNRLFEEELKTHVFVDSCRCRTEGNKPIGIAGINGSKQFLDLSVAAFPTSLSLPLRSRTFELEISIN